MKSIHSSRFQTGITMVEILIALVISMFLLGGVIQVYIANKASYTFTEAVGRIQENGRYAIEQLAQDLRMAGFFGCALWDPEDDEDVVNNLDPNGVGYSDQHDFLNGDLIGGTEGDGLNGSDSIEIRGVKPGQYNVQPPYNVDSAAQIFITANDEIQPDDIVMISNCRGADIFQVTNATQSANSNSMSVVHNTGTGEPGNYNPDNCKGGNAHCLSQTYGADAALFRLQALIYDIRPGASGEPALWRSEVGRADVELVEGIEQMQVLYGLDTDDDDFPNRYLTIDQVANPYDTYDIVSVRVMLLVRSADQFVAEEPQTYTFNGATVTPNDRRLRQEFTATVTLRNRVGSGT